MVEKNQVGREESGWSGRIRNSGKNLVGRNKKWFLKKKYIFGNISGLHGVERNETLAGKGTGLTQRLRL